VSGAQLWISDALLFTGFHSFFLPAVMLAYFILSVRSIVLLVFSLAFYAWGEAQLVWLLIAVICGNYEFCLGIKRSGQYRRVEGGRARRLSASFLQPRRPQTKQVPLTQPPKPTKANTKLASWKWSRLRRLSC
jgi:hypothetical protein